MKCDGGIGLTIYNFLLILSANIWRNAAPLRDIGFQNLTDLDSELERSLRTNVITLMDSPIYAFLLMLNGNIWPNSAPLQDKNFEI